MDRRAKIAELEARTRRLESQLSKSAGATLSIRGATRMNDLILAFLNEVFDAVAESSSPATSKVDGEAGDSVLVAGTLANGQALRFEVDWTSKTFEASSDDTLGDTYPIFKAPLSRVMAMPANRLASLIHQKM